MIAASLSAPQAVCSSCSMRSSSAAMLLARRAATPLVSRSISTRVYAAAAPADSLSAEGVKSKLYEILTGAKPMTADEIWAEAEKKGVRSKSHMKSVLQDLRKRGWVVTKPGAVASAKRDKSFRYELTEKTMQSPRYKGPKPE